MQRQTELHGHLNISAHMPVMCADPVTEMSWAVVAEMVCAAWALRWCLVDPVITPGERIIQAGELTFPQAPVFKYGVCGEQAYESRERNLTPGPRRRMAVMRLLGRTRAGGGAGQGQVGSSRDPLQAAGQAWLSLP